MIEIRGATLEDVPDIARVHAKADWETYAPLFGAQAYALEVAECERLAPGIAGGGRAAGCHGRG